jgi:predicted PurR-regulated permease PerM
MISQSGIGKALMQHVDTTNVQTSPTSMLQNFFGVAANVVAIVGGIVVIVFTALYVAAESPRYADGLVQRRAVHLPPR